MTEPVSEPLLTGSLVFSGWEPEPNSLIHVEILDVTYVDAPSVKVAAEEIRFEPTTARSGRDLDGDARFPFKIWGSVPDADADYIVVATVVAADSATVVGRSTAAHPVLTHGYPARQVDVHVTAM